MNDLTPTDRAVMRLGVLTGLLVRVKAAEGKAREEVTAALGKGDAKTARSPIDDDVLIKASMSDPKDEATVIDRKAVDAWICDNYLAKTEIVTRIIGSNADVLDALREHAPFLVEDVRVVPDWAVNELVVKSAGAGEPVGYGGEMGEQAPPGIKVSKPDGRLTVSKGKNAQHALEQMWAAGLVDLDGNLREITAGGEN